MNPTNFTSGQGGRPSRLHPSPCSSGILWYLTGKIPTLDALKDELGRAIKRFAKRQMVWFQKDRDVLWLDMEVDFLTQAVRAVEDFLA